MEDMFNEGWEKGRRDTMRQLAPLTEAILDALVMFKDIEKARNLPSYPDVLGQYVAMGKQLERLLDLSGLKEFVECD